MQILWMIAGGVIGWILIEIVAAMTKTPMPIVFNFGLLFVGGLIGYSLGG